MFDVHASILFVFLLYRLVILLFLRGYIDKSPVSAPLFGTRRTYEHRHDFRQKRL